MSISNIKKILVPVDFSITSRRVLEEVSYLAKISNAKVILFTSLEGPLGDSGPDYFGISIYNRIKYENLILQWAEKNLKKLKGELQKAGAKDVTYKIEKGKAYKKIIKAAKVLKPDLIIMGTPTAFQGFVNM